MIGIVRRWDGHALIDDAPSRRTITTDHHQLSGSFGDRPHPAHVVWRGLLSSATDDTRSAHQVVAASDDRSAANLHNFRSGGLARPTSLFLHSSLVRKRDVHRVIKCGIGSPR